MWSNEHEKVTSEVIEGLWYLNEEQFCRWVSPIEAKIEIGESTQVKCLKVHTLSKWAEKHPGTDTAGECQNFKISD